VARCDRNTVRIYLPVSQSLANSLFGGQKEALGEPLARIFKKIVTLLTEYSEITILWY
jgi:hypothetical protein